MMQFRNLIARKRPRTAEPEARAEPAPAVEAADIVIAPAAEGPADPGPAALPEPFVAQSRPVILPEAVDGAPAVPPDADEPALPDDPRGTALNRQELAGARLRQAGRVAAPAGGRANIWDIDPVDGADAGDDAAMRAAVATAARAAIPEPVAEPAPDPAPEPAPEPARRRRPAGAAPAAEPAASTGRIKTRILGFHAAEVEPAPIDGPRAAPAEAALFPAGWIVVVEGAGRGHAFAVAAGVSTIGRGEDQTIRLDFGDRSISRENHASIAYDEEQNRFFIGHGGKSNIVRRNGHPVLSTEELDHADLIRIGKTTLRFVALCGPDFTWAEDTEAQGQDDTDG